MENYEEVLKLYQKVLEKKQMTAADVKYLKKLMHRKNNR